MADAPIIYEWNGDAMVPIARLKAQADRQFVEHVRYRLVEEDERSEVSHRHYFAALREAWQNLPEELTAEFPSTEHMRKKLLIRCGFATERQVVCETEAEARRLEAAVVPMDEYAIVQRQGCIVTIWTAESQRHRAQRNRRFQNAKTAVLDAAAALVGVTVDQLYKNAGRSA